MQNAKDSFYIALRNRMAALNPTRAINIRGVQRPAILVEDAESPMGELLNDIFLLRWTTCAVIENMPCLFVSMECEMHYATSGSQNNSGLDRGRFLNEMDYELLTILQPLCTPKLKFTMTPTTKMQTNVFWTEPVLGTMETQRNQLLRIAKVTVFAFQEPGES